MQNINSKIFILLFAIFIFYFAISVHTQDTKKLDSLWNKYNKAKHDTTRIKLYLDIGDAYEYIIPDTALLYYNKALELANKAEMEQISQKGQNTITTAIAKLKASSLSSISLIYSLQGDNNKAISYSLKSLKIDEAIKNEKGMSASFTNLGFIYSDMGDYTQALGYFQKALNILIKSGNKDGLFKCYGNIGNVYKGQGNYAQAFEYFLKSLKIAEELGDKIGMAKCYGNLGIIHSDQGNYVQAIDYYFKSLKIFDETGHKVDISTCYINIGNIHKDQGSYDKAIEYYLKSLKISEELGDKNGISNCYGNIGNISREQSDYPKAIEYFFSSLKISEEIGDKNSMSKNYNNIGIIYQIQCNYEKAIEYFYKSLSIAEELGDKVGMAHCYCNIGTIYKYQGLYDNAIRQYNQSLKICYEINIKEGIVINLDNIASLYISLADSVAKNEKQRIDFLKKSLEYGNKAYELAVEIDALPTENRAAESIMNAYKKLGNSASAKASAEYYKMAMQYADIFIATKDSMFKEEKIKSIAEAEKKFEAEKKQLQIEKLSKEKELQRSELLRQKEHGKRQKLVILFTVLGFLFMVVFAVFVVHRLRITRRQKRTIEEQKALVDEKNIALNQQNEEIRTQRDQIQANRDEIATQRDKLDFTLTELRQTQEQLIESKKMASLGSLVAGIAHEINTPVGIGITASSSLVEQTKQFATLYKGGQMTRQQLEEYLENVYQTGSLVLKNMNRPGELVRSFKQVSVDQITEEKRKFLLKPYIEDILFSLKPEFGKKQITTTIDCNQELEIDSYPGIYAQIITNLILNSIRHGFREMDTGDITIIVYVGTNGASTPLSNHRSSLHIQYIDNGCGIPAENLPKIFDPFFTTNKQTGTGLGLNIVYNLVTQKLKGTIKCESTTGKGIEFIIKIPF
ncbi:MAG: tetratricopeptide repeat protein [Bacteroidia bacterium]|nr:tetratricopeptide repeat protein [Bacteroidia bacterium]